MARFQRHFGGFRSSLPSQQHCSFASSSSSSSSSEEEDDEEEDEVDEQEEECPISSPLIVPGPKAKEGERRENQRHHQIVTVLVAALRKSLVMCSVACGQRGASPASMEIGWPTDARHLAHVTFDRFDGFLGLPAELEPEVPPRVPSASTSIFGVSVESMQCSYDKRGNSVPTILLSMQRHLYLQGGLQVEGIFRINAENSQEVFLREQLNRGIVLHGTDLHCLAGLIKAWFRELPRGVLDSLTPDQVMHCNTEEVCSEIARMLPPTEAALLEWAINLMADVVEHEHYNKMNARNIAMVFAPNMTQMADPLTELIHAVQVMNFLKTLIIKTLREREEASFTAIAFSSYSESPSDKDEATLSKPSEKYALCTNEKILGIYALDKVAIGKLLFNGEPSLGSSEGSFEPKIEMINELDATRDECQCGHVYGDVESMMDRVSFRKVVRKFCSRPIFQLSRCPKKQAKLVNLYEGREAWT